MAHPRIVLTIAGSDSSGGAGIQADIKTISALGGYAASAITALTAQNTQGVQAIEPASLDILKSQIESVFEDLPVAAVKIGMLHSPEVVQLVADCLAHFRPKHVVLDPVMIATSGDVLVHPSAVKALVERLFPLASLITPNLDEAAHLLGRPLKTIADMEMAGDALIAKGAQAVLIKGGHLPPSAHADIVDLLVERSAADPSHASTQSASIVHRFEKSRILTQNTHGTGCSLSSAIATHLAHGEPLPQAVRLAQDYVHQGLLQAQSMQLGSGSGPINHFFQPRALVLQ
ncbi:MAG: bifunctional hydroxymethylpyrimidine kinase/phosphomethylpyrimidine kinase [Betaproteobacteria bacterium]|nr:bifunctional hydroxymethylpyrimidine kinase/phosphomethylpyrimidine kinase [Betaproteobacteria bacterium]